MFLIFAAVILLATPSLQSTPAIRGVIVDISGAAVPEAVATAVRSNGQEVPLTVSGDGSFVAEGGA
jgi:hypothetical protein